MLLAAFLLPMSHKGPEDLEDWGAHTKHTAVASWAFASDGGSTACHRQAHMKWPWPFMWHDTYTRADQRGQVEAQS